VACGSGIVTVNSPSGSTLQCDTWLWNDMPLNSLKRPPYWNSTSGFLFHTSPQSTCHSVPVCEILSKSDHARLKKITSCRFWKMADLSHLGFYGSNNGFFEKPNYITSYRSSIDSSKLLSFWENRVFAFWRQDPRLRISAILDCRRPMMGSLKSPCTTSYRSLIETIALNCSVEKIAFLHFGIKIKMANLRHLGF